MHMTKLLQNAIARVQTLSDEEQDRAASVLLAFAGDNRNYSFTAEQIAGIEHAMQQADRGEFATDKEVEELFDAVV